MDYVRGALLALAVFWAMQVIGSWYQMRRYGDAVRDTASRWKGGFLGVGSCKVRFGRGAIAIVVLSADMRICDFLSMSGLTVFSRFHRHEGYAGLSIDEFTAQLTGTRLRRAIVRAAADALDRAKRAAETRTSGTQSAEAKAEADAEAGTPPAEALTAQAPA